MAFDPKAGFVGLVTATAEVGGAPGGLRIADNVTLRKEGALMPRPISTSTALPRQYRAAFPYRGRLFFIAANNAVYYDTGTAYTYAAGIGAGGAPVVIAPPAVRDDVQAAKEARGNLYFASASGVTKVTGIVYTGLFPTGLTPTTTGFGFAQVINTGTNDLLTTGQQVAYRIVTTITDPNGLVIRSRPSGAVTVVATGTQTPYLTFYYTSFSVAAAVARTLEIYRTRIFPAGVQVDDEMQLVASLVLPPQTATSVSIYDRVPDARRGTTLYTSPSRGGVENANDRPPGCACIERFRGSLFFGNITGPQRITISYSPTPVATGSATGIGPRATTGTNAAGATTITSVSNTTGVQIGQLVQTQTSGFAGGMVTAIAGSTVTVSAPLPNAQTAQTVNFVDALRVSAPGMAPMNVAFGVGPGVTFGGAYATTSGAVSNNFYGEGWTAYEITPPEAGYSQTVVVERVARGEAAFTASASHGDEVSPALPLTSSGTTVSSKNDVFPHGLAWSEPDEPEHVPPKNFARVGDAGKAILALVATKDRLLIFKEDGLFMLTGNTARDFGIYPLDTTCLCVLPGSVRRLKNTVYVLTNLGLCAVDESGGVQVISRPIQLEVAAIVNAIRAAQKTTGLYNMPGLTGTTGAGDDANGEYHLALGSSTPSFGGQVLVYSLPRDGFTTFSYGTPAPVALATDGEGNPLVLTASSLLTPNTTLGAVTARVSPRAFADPALLGKLWTHLVAGFSQLTGTTSVQAVFTSSESMQAAASITETIEAPLDTGLVQLPRGSLLRHPIPSAVRRAYLLFVELVIAVSNGTFTLETLAAESRENIPNKRPSTGTGST